jgi:UDP-N-acetylglucosamine--N-acetylmuramyl-(pentapeptide) pyrophosphoryl-undecaprenol N-acetylglucosamine transferase
MSAKNAAKGNSDIHVNEFIGRMDLAYAVADVVISRAGAISISELCLAGKPVVFVPSANVAEDHQTKNAMALVDKDAAVMVSDAEAADKMVDEALALLNDNSRREKLSINIKSLGKPRATEEIVNELEKLLA